MREEKLAVIIATKDRPNELKQLLKNISLQDAKPIQVIIVDGGDTPIQGLVDSFSGLRIDYIRSVPASLTTQRNAGIRGVLNEATLVAFFDDDVILEQEAIKNMMRFWETASEDTAGAAFNLTNEMCEKASIFEKVFLVNADRQNAVLRSGFQSKVSFQNETVPVEWLVGCAMVWRKNIFEKFLFDERFTGYARYEEVDFSYRVGRLYKMFIVADARAEHQNIGTKNIECSFSLGEMEVGNRLYFARKNPGLSLALCCWASFGLFLNNLIKGLLHRDRNCLLKAKGNIAGFFSFIKEKS